MQVGQLVDDTLLAMIRVDNDSEIALTPEVVGLLRIYLPTHSQCSNLVPTLCVGMQSPTLCVAPSARSAGGYVKGPTLRTPQLAIA